MSRFPNDDYFSSMFPTDLLQVVSLSLSGKSVVASLGAKDDSLGATTTWQIVRVPDATVWGNCDERGVVAATVMERLGTLVGALLDNAVLDRLSEVTTKRVTIPAPTFDPVAVLGQALDLSAADAPIAMSEWFRERLTAAHPEAGGDSTFTYAGRPSSSSTAMWRGYYPAPSAYAGQEAGPKVQIGPWGQEVRFALSDVSFEESIPYGSPENWRQAETPGSSPTPGTDLRASREIALRFRVTCAANVGDTTEFVAAELDAY